MPPYANLESKVLVSSVVFLKIVLFPAKCILIKYSYSQLLQYYLVPY